MHDELSRWQVRAGLQQLRDLRYEVREWWLRRALNATASQGISRLATRTTRSRTLWIAR